MTPRVRFFTHSEDDLAGKGVIHRVGQQVGKNLFQIAGVGLQEAISPVQFLFEGQPLAPGLFAGDIQCPAERLDQVDRLHRIRFLEPLRRGGVEEIANRIDGVLDPAPGAGK